jgi:uncharacterized protein YcfL
MKLKLVLCLMLVFCLAVALLTFGCASTPPQSTYDVKLIDMKSKIPIAGLNVTMIFPSITKQAQTDKHGIARFDVEGEPAEATIKVTTDPFYYPETIHLAHPLPYQVEIELTERKE